MSCRCWCSRDPVTTCGDCDRQYLMIDVRFYRAALKAGMVGKVKKLERRASAKKGKKSG